MCAQALEKSKIENTKINKAKARGETLSVSAFGAGLRMSSRRRTPDVVRPSSVSPSPAKSLCV